MQPNAYPDETQRLELGTTLQLLVNSLNEYCDQEPPPPLAYQLNEFIATLGEYDQATEQLLTDYRHALEHAERPVTQPVPTLEQAILAKLSPEQLLAHREKDPVYRLGYVRGYEKGKQQNDRLLSLYAQYALIVPPASYTPSPVVAQAQRFVAARLMTGPRFPLPVRKSLFFSSPHAQS